MGLLFATPAHASIEADRSSAIVFVYQRVGEETVQNSSISVDQFRAHINELKAGGYKVLPLSRIVSAVRAGEALPQNTIGITFDGAYLSTINNAIPMLDESGLPYTIFFSTDMADAPAPGHASWAQLKSLRGDQLAGFGIMPSSYTHMAGQTPAQNAAIINKAVTRYRDEMREEPEFFAYPYGEYSVAVKKALADYPFKAAFALQSGVVHGKSDFLALPRFIMTDSFGDLERFRLTANALPLPVSDVIPEDMIVRENPPMIGFTVSPELHSLTKLSCFASGIGKLDIARAGSGRVEIRFKAPLQDRRTRVNCTLPDETIIPGRPQSWRWFGMQLIATDMNDGEDNDTDGTNQSERDDDTGANPVEE
ncbi:MAG TPA: polysaccharide deacetylase family protein [Patescibacteria group bacterium]|nr:polysaccharide deacetylase family protein [Patescibacteria group bacterium]